MAVTGGGRKCRPASVNSKLKPRRMGLSAEGKRQDGRTDEQRPLCDSFIASNMLRRHKHRDDRAGRCFQLPVFYERWSANNVNGCADERRRAITPIDDALF